MRIFNADGSESAVCGNGLRCLVSHYLNATKHKKYREIIVETSIGLRTAKISRDKEQSIEIQVNMGEPQIGLKQTPLNELQSQENTLHNEDDDTTVEANGRKLLLNLVSVGNPHAVHFIDYAVKDFPLTELGAKVEQHQLFPDETNFEVVRIINRKKIEARVWERE